VTEGIEALLVAKVVSNYGADGSGNYTTYVSDTIVQGSTVSKFMAYNVFDANDPSVCEVFFYIGNTAVSDRCINQWKTQQLVKLL